MSPDASPALEATPKLKPRRSELTAHRPPLQALTGIRFFAATYVVVFHTRFAEVARAHVSNAAGNFFASGYLAVPLFFLLSGFILAYTYEGQIATRSDHRRFWEARFARIWPLYVVSLLANTAVFGGIPKLPIAAATLLMVQAWNPFNIGMAGAWNLVCWTLSTEALFYLIFPFVQTWLDRRSWRAQAIFLATVVLICIVCNTSGRSLGYAPMVGAYRYTPLAVIHVPEFLTGVALGNLYLRWRARQTGQPILPGGGWWTWISAAIVIGLLCRGPGPLTSLIVPAFAALLFGLAAEPSLLRTLLSTPALLLGGQISYGMYLMQMPLKTAVDGLLTRLHSSSLAVRFGGDFAALLLISLLGFKFVEDPSRKLLRSAFAGIEARRKKIAAWPA